MSIRFDVSEFRARLAAFAAEIQAEVAAGDLTADEAIAKATPSAAALQVLRSSNTATHRQLAALLADPGRKTATEFFGPRGPDDGSVSEQLTNEWFRIVSFFEPHKTDVEADDEDEEDELFQDKYAEYVETYRKRLLPLMGYVKYVLRLLAYEYAETLAKPFNVPFPDVLHKTEYNVREDDLLGGLEEDAASLVSALITSIQNRQVNEASLQQLIRVNQDALDSLRQLSRSGRELANAEMIERLGRLPSRILDEPVGAPPAIVGDAIRDVNTEYKTLTNIVRAYNFNVEFNEAGGQILTLMGQIDAHFELMRPHLPFLRLMFAGIAEQVDPRFTVNKLQLLTLAKAPYKRYLQELEMVRNLNTVEVDGARIPTDVMEAIYGYAGITERPPTTGVAPRAPPSNAATIAAGWGRVVPPVLMTPKKETRKRQNGGGKKRAQKTRGQRKRKGTPRNA